MSNLGWGGEDETGRRGRRSRRRSGKGEAEEEGEEREEEEEKEGEEREKEEEEELMAIGAHASATRWAGCRRCALTCLYTNSKSPTSQFLSRRLSRITVSDIES